MLGRLVNVTVSVDKGREEFDVLDEEDCVVVVEVLVEVPGALDDEDCEEVLEALVDELGGMNGEGDEGRGVVLVGELPLLVVESST